MTNEQTDFVLAVQARYDLLDLEIPEAVEDVFKELFRSIADNNDCEVARIAGCMIIELERFGDPLSCRDAARWLELFGGLATVPV
jgi:hypothetical protein